MKFRILGTMALIVWGTSAEAQSNYRSQCGWVDGVYRCYSTTETPFSTTDTLCASGGVDSKCVSKTKPKPPSEAKTDQRDNHQRRDDTSVTFNARSVQIASLRSQ